MVKFQAKTCNFSTDRNCINRSLITCCWVDLQQIKCSMTGSELVMLFSN